MNLWELEDGRKIRLLTPQALADLPNGTVLLDIFGETAVVGEDTIDDDTRAGFLAYGVEQ